MNMRLHIIDIFSIWSFNVVYWMELVILIAELFVSSDNFVHV